MYTFVHISGIYSVNEKGDIVEQAPLDPALLQQGATVQTSALTSLPESLLANVLTQIPSDAVRQVNIQLTKRSVQQSVTPDLLIINASNGIEELDKVCNALSKRLREWYALYDPELEHAYKDHKAFIDAVLQRTSERKEDTMGATFAEQDSDTVLSQARTVQQLYVQRESLVEYLEGAMQQHLPNVRAVAGALIGAKLLALAGSLERLSRMPSSTVQLLGAETALFRHLRNRKARPPKHGIIFNHLLLQRSPRPMRGKVARALADKISIAARVDYFSGDFIGDKLFSQVEERTRV
jgi:nucleolar protein 56